MKQHSTVEEHVALFYSQQTVNGSKISRTSTMPHIFNDLGASPSKGTRLGLAQNPK